MTIKYSPGHWKTPPSLEKPRKIVLVSGSDSSLVFVGAELEGCWHGWLGQGVRTRAPLQYFSRSAPLPVSSGNHCGEGWQLQCAAQPPVHQHQEQNDLLVRQLERQRLSGTEDLRFPAADDFSNLLRQRVLRKLQQFRRRGWWETPECSVVLLCSGLECAPPCQLVWLSNLTAVPSPQP